MDGKHERKIGLKDMLGSRVIFFMSSNSKGVLINIPGGEGG